MGKPKTERVLKNGATRRLELHINAFRSATMGLNVGQIGLLMDYLMAEVVEAPMPRITDRMIKFVFDMRDEYSRIRGGFGRVGLTPAVRRSIFERDNAECQYCGRSITWEEYHCDHVDPVAKGGSDHPSNLVAACRDCNLSKAARTLAEWRP